MLEEKEKKLHSASGLGAFLTRWLTACKRMKRSVGKRNASVLLKVNIVLLISLDFSNEADLGADAKTFLGLPARAQDGTLTDS